jgi:probable rRNA maturation factor
MIEINNKTKTKINLKSVRKVTDKFFKYYKVGDKELSVVFIGDSLMRRLNREHRGKDKPTDVLSFNGEGDDLGEILIDYAQIKRQAKKYSGSVEKELIFILVHGLLHLVGYEDETDEGAGEMERVGEKFIKLRIKN